MFSKPGGGKGNLKLPEGADPSRPPPTHNARLCALERCGPWTYSMDSDALWGPGSAMARGRGHAVGVWRGPWCGGCCGAVGGGLVSLRERLQRTGDGHSRAGPRSRAEDTVAFGWPREGAASRQSRGEKGWAGACGSRQGPATGSQSHRRLWDPPGRDLEMEKAGRSSTRAHCVPRLGRGLREQEDPPSARILPLEAAWRPDCLPRGSGATPPARRGPGSARCSAPACAECHSPPHRRVRLCPTGSPLGAVV